MHRKKYLVHRVLHVREAEKFLGSYIKIPKSQQALYSHLSLPLLNPFKRLKREKSLLPSRFIPLHKNRFAQFLKEKNPRQEASLRVLSYQFWVYLGKAGSLSNNF